MTPDIDQSKFVEMRDRILAGEDFKLEREGRFLLNPKTAGNREIDGVRLYLRTSGGRWRKTEMWLVGKGDETVVDVLGHFANWLSA